MNSATQGETHGVSVTNTEFSALIDTFGGFGVVLDLAAGVFVAAGRELARKLGYRRSDLVAARLEEFVHPDDLERAASLLGERSEFIGDDLGTVVRVRTAAGEWEQHLVSASPVGGGSLFLIEARPVDPDDPMGALRQVRNALVAEELANSISTRLLEASGPGRAAATIAALEQLCRYTGAHAATLWSSTGPDLVATVHWSRSGDLPPSPVAADAALAPLCEAALVVDPGDVVDPGHEPVLALPASSILATPTPVADRPGFLVLSAGDGPRWEDYHLRLLANVASALAAALSADYASGLLASIFDASPLPLAIASSRGEVVTINEELDNRLGHGDLPPAARFARLLSAEHLDGFVDTVRNVIANAEVATVSLTACSTDVERFWEVTVAPIRLAFDSAPVCLVTVADVTDVRARHMELRHAALHDHRTGLLNAAGLDEEVEQLDAGEPISVLYVDLDEFKATNDTWGHAIGDKVLEVVGARIAAVTRPTDIAARIGGDEFIVIARDLDGPETEALSCRIAETIAEPMTVSGRRTIQRASVGTARGTGGDVLRLKRTADSAMYEAKRQPRSEGLR
ncbi:MAG: sensor domain-containing diguanylate cyclase [Actinomycetota bacterium]